MTKKDFYHELRKLGVDITNPSQMKIWSTALMSLGKKMLEGRAERCVNCYFSNNAIGEDGKPNPDLCTNDFCPVKNMPNTPAKVIDQMFNNNEPLDMDMFYVVYAKPIIEKAMENSKDARDNDKGNN